MHMLRELAKLDGHDDEGTIDELSSDASQYNTDRFLEEF
jgi:hypothetical protein